MMEQVRKALSRAKTAFEKIQNHKKICDHLLDEDELSLGREIYEIELALKELEQSTESCVVNSGGSSCDICGGYPGVIVVTEKGTYCIDHAKY